jgi:hypothetical protein
VVILRAPRVALCGAVLAAAIGLVAAALPDSGPPRADVGTRDDGREEAVDRPADDPQRLEPTTPPPTHEPEHGHEQLNTGGVVDPATTEATEASPTPPTTTPTSPPSVPTTTTTVPTFAGPDHLRGRLVFVEDQPAPNTLYSAALDGTDRRAEVPCPSPQTPFTYPASVSPDGRWVARLCQVAPLRSPPESPFGRTTLVVQRVDGSATRVLWDRFGQMLLPPAWSPDGETLATERSGDLVLIAVDDGSRRSIDLRRADDVEVPVWGRLSWSPEGTEILMDGPWIIDVATGMARSAIPLGWREGQADMTAWTPDGSLFFRFRPRQHHWEPRPADPWVRQHPEPSEWIDTVIAGLEPAPNGDPAHTIQGPLFFGPHLALVVIDGNQLWRLDIGPSHAYDRTHPIGSLTLVDDHFRGAFPSGVPPRSGIPSTG